MRKTPNLYSIWNKVPVTYYQKGAKRNLFQFLWHGHKIKNAERLMSKIKFDNCMDVGCASGYMISQIAKKFPKKSFTGVDVYDKAILYAKNKYPHIKFIIAPADKLPFRDNSIDLILCYETIEHVEDPEKTLSELKRILANKGTLLLTMDSGSLLFRIVWFVWENTKGRVWKGAHLHPFHHDELENLIKKSGFKIKEKFFSFLGMEVNFVLTK